MWNLASITTKLLGKAEAPAWGKEAFLTLQPGFQTSQPNYPAPDWDINHLKIPEDRFLWPSLGFKPAALQRCLARSCLPSRESMWHCSVAQQLQSPSSAERAKDFSFLHFLPKQQFHSFLFWNSSCLTLKLTSIRKVTGSWRKILATLRYINWEKY